MGGSVSHTDSHIIFVQPDGAMGIHEAFAAKYEEHVPFPIKRPLLTRAHESLIKKHWAAISKGTSAFDASKHLTPHKFFYTTFYGILFESAPCLRPMFRSSMTVQGKSLSSIICILASVINADNVVTAVQDMARRHAFYGTEKGHYIAVGEILLETLKRISGPEIWTCEIQDAYLTAYCFLYFIMLPVILNATVTPLSPSIPGTIKAVEALSTTIQGLTIVVSYPLRFHPGDAVLLGYTDEKTGAQICRHYAIANFSDGKTGEIRVCIDRTLGTAGKFLAQHLIQGASVHVYWIESDVHLEIDSPETLPQAPLFVSYGGVAAVPFLTMIKGLYSIAKTMYTGSIVALQCAPTRDEIQYFLKLRDPMTNAPVLNWTKCNIAYATAATIETLLEVAPDLATRELYVSGPPAFIESTVAAFIEAGGMPRAVHIYSFDNAKFPCIQRFVTTQQVTPLSILSDEYSREKVASAI
jgi:ferredoxin-NADP reductase/hemoglobin-like flavoprotein